MDLLFCRELLAAPVQEATALLQGRMPVPKLLECDQGGSQACHTLKSLECIVTLPSEGFYLCSCMHMASRLCMLAQICGCCVVFVKDCQSCVLLWLEALSPDLVNSWAGSSHLRQVGACANRPCIAGTHHQPLHVFHLLTVLNLFAYRRAFFWRS